ncbi:heavy metal translocating P-type ATPase [Pontimonas sp.]|nr:heavy metal translocating P-type ATPase [Pontimonas sp.]MDA8909327.1 heavy metal translocating P-type ATPase [Pontimonas sp.]
MSTVIQLDIEGMTCASCATRIEKALNKVEGAEASVNYATERATILSDSSSLEALIQVVQSTGYEASKHGDRPSSAEGHSPLVTRLVVSALVSVPLMVVSMIPALQFIGWQWVVTVLALPIATWGAWPFHKAAGLNLRHGVVTMDTLISLGITAATGWSLYALFFGGAGELGMTMTLTLIGTHDQAGAEIYLEVAAALTTFMLMGRYLENRAKREAGAALRALLESGAAEATVLRDGVEKVVPIALVRVSDHLVVRPGERIPTDGEVLEGSAAIDTSMMTGESVPRDVVVGDTVWGGTINVTGFLRMQATRVGAETELARMASLVEAAQQGKSASQRLADRVSSVFVPIVIVLSLLTLAGWLLAGASADFAFQAAVATVIIACPCALGLATPTALLVGTGRGAQLGLLIRGPEVIEKSRSLDTIIVDKTGSLTTGAMQVSAVMSAEGASESDVLDLALSLERGSEHPIGRAIVAHATERESTERAITNFVARIGLGVEGQQDGVSVSAGTPEWVHERDITTDHPLQSALDQQRLAGSTVVVITRGDSAVGAIALSDTLRATSARAIQELTALGLTPILASGDHDVVAQHVAKAVGVDRVFSAMTPEGKATLITELQSQGHTVAMVGDGINDAPGLATADVGIAMGSGSDAAMTAGDITIVQGDILAVSDGIRLSRRTLRTIQANLFWAFAYNVAAIPLAMAGLLNPLLAGLAMALSSVFVVSNSLRLCRFRPTTQ